MASVLPALRFVTPAGPSCSRLGATRTRRAAAVARERAEAAGDARGAHAVERDLREQGHAVRDAQASRGDQHRCLDEQQIARSVIHDEIRASRCALQLSIKLHRRRHFTRSNRARSGTLSRSRRADRFTVILAARYAARRPVAFWRARIARRLGALIRRRADALGCRDPARRAPSQQGCRVRRDAENASIASG